MELSVQVLCLVKEYETYSEVTCLIYTALSVIKTVYFYVN